MRFAIEQDDKDPQLIRYWWKQEFNGKEYGQFLLIRLPIDNLEPYTEAVKRSFELHLSQIDLEEADEPA